MPKQAKCHCRSLSQAVSKHRSEVVSKLTCAEQVADIEDAIQVACLAWMLSQRGKRGGARMFPCATFLTRVRNCLRNFRQLAAIYRRHLHAFERTLPEERKS